MKKKSRKNVPEKMAVILLSLGMALAGFAQTNAGNGKDTTAVRTPDSKTYAVRFEKFATEVAARDTLSKEQKAKYVAAYNGYLEEYKVVKDSLSDDDVRKCSKSKVVYQKAMARVFVSNASKDVTETAEGVGDKVSKFFKKTKKKVQGAIEGFKEN